jgi:hypothetical protein
MNKIINLNLNIVHTLLACALIYGATLQFKGFAGYDLSPMISYNNAISSGAGNVFISNPMPPGFQLIIYIFGGFSFFGYSGYFIGNSLFLLTLYLIAFYAIKKCGSQIYNSQIFCGIIAVCTTVSAVTDGHFYVSDTSNTVAVIVTLIIVWMITTPAPQQNLLINLAPLSLANVFLIFLKPNIGIPLFIFNFILIVSWPHMSGNRKISYRFLASFSISTIGSFLLWIFIFSLLMQFQFDAYLETILELRKTRGSLDYDNFKFNVLDRGFWGTRQVGAYYLLTFGLLIGLILSLMPISTLIAAPTAFLIGFFLIFTYSNPRILSTSLIGLIGACWAVELLKKWLVKGITKIDLSTALASLILFSAGNITILTNYDVRSSSFMLYLGSIGLLILSKGHRKLVSGHAAVKATLPWVFLLFFAFSIEGYYRLKILLAGSPSVKGDFSQVVQDNFFWRLSTSRYHADATASIDQAISDARHMGLKGIVFGARLEYLYEKYKITPPEGLPLWWHYGTSYLAKDRDTIRQVLVGASVDLVVCGLIGDQPDTALLDDELRSVLLDETIFQKDRSHKGIMVFRKISPQNQSPAPAGDGLIN